MTSARSARGRSPHSRGRARCRGSAGLSSTAATPVVPEPQKGSRTRPPSGVASRTSQRMSCERLDRRVRVAEPATARAGRPGVGEEVERAARAAARSRRRARGGWPWGSRTAGSARRRPCGRPSAACCRAAAGQRARSAAAAAGAWVSDDVGRPARPRVSMVTPAGPRAARRDAAGVDVQGAGAVAARRLLGVGAAGGRRARMIGS